ncbi:MAG TPA: hypothetical protein EYH03_02275 [Chromatiales bacterium]|nr:hypothetical protein [Chromatiales bacterium]
MRSPSPWLVRLENVRRGIDNTHIDVVLSKRFRARASLLIQRLINQDIGLNCWPDAGPVPEHDDMERFREVYQNLMEAGLARASRSTGPQYMQLWQLVVFKALLQMVKEELEQLRSQMRQTRGMEGTLSRGKSMELHERLVLITKEETAIVYRVTRRLFRFLHRLEGTIFRKIRKSSIGISWPVPKEALFNPLMQLSSFDAAEEFMRHYPLLLNGEEGIAHFGSVNRLFWELFQDYLPLWVVPPKHQTEPFASRNGDAGFPLLQRQDQGGLSGFVEVERRLARTLSEDEYQAPKLSWVDVPENINLFINSVVTGGRASNVAARTALPWPQKHWPDFQRRLLQRFCRGLEKQDLDQKIIASYRTHQLHRQLRGGIGVNEIYGFLSGQLSRKKLIQRLDHKALGLVERLDQEVREMAQLSTEGRHAYLTRFLYDFLVYRRDLKFAFKTHQAMDQLRFLEKEEDIVLSRTNGTLYEFHLGSEVRADPRRIRSHVILKADVRGSTAITSRLRANQLNPASHFSLNFFEPINKLLEEFGATKVFVEGDAVILACYEYEGDDVRWLSVARSCGLAARILAVVRAQNLNNKVQGLPDLELGIGIAFDKEAPAFLYDNDHKITISPAINRADQLSSCSPELQGCKQCGRDRARRVEVAVRADASPEGPPYLSRLLRFNVNGVELDGVAFRKLQSEMVLQQVVFHTSSGEAKERFHAGRYPDPQGIMHWLVIREAAVKVWDGKDLSAVDAEGRRFYEVVTDTDLIEQVKRRLRSG